MSYANFVKALELAPQCKFYTTAGGKSDEEIGASEKILGVTFSKQCKEFYKKLGYLSFFGSEIFGIDPYDDSGILEGNSVAYALNDRTELGLPVAWIPIYDYNDGSMAYLDYSSLNRENEPRVLAAFYNGKKFEVTETVAEDLGDFILGLVQEQVE